MISPLGGSGVYFTNPNQIQKFTVNTEVIVMISPLGGSGVYFTNPNQIQKFTVNTEVIRGYKEASGRFFQVSSKWLGQGSILFHIFLKTKSSNRSIYCALSNADTAKKLKQVWLLCNVGLVCNTVVDVLCKAVKYILLCNSFVK